MPNIKYSQSCCNTNQVILTKFIVLDEKNQNFSLQKIKYQSLDHNRFIYNLLDHN